MSCAAPPPPPPPPPTPAPPPPAETQAPLPEDEIREKRADTRGFEERFTAELARVNRNMGACFQSDPDASGRIALMLVLDDEGTSSNTFIRESDLPEPVQQCILEAMRDMRDLNVPGGHLELPLPPFDFERGKDVSSKL